MPFSIPAWWSQWARYKITFPVKGGKPVKHSHYPITGDCPAIVETNPKPDTEIWRVYKGPHDAVYLVNYASGRLIDLHVWGGWTRLCLREFDGSDGKDESQQFVLHSGGSTTCRVESVRASGSHPKRQLWSTAEETHPRRPYWKDSEIVMWNEGERQGQTYTFEEIDRAPLTLKVGAKPFEIGDPPKPQGSNIPEKGKRVLIGQTTLPFFMVRDPDPRWRYPERADRAVQEVPYYVLTREQYWSRVKRLPHSGEAGSHTMEYTTGFSEEDSTSFESTTTIGITSSLDFLIKKHTLGLTGSLQQELKVKTTSTRSRSTQKKVTRVFNVRATEPGQTIYYGAYAIHDHYSLRRYTTETESKPISEWYTVPEGNFATTTSL